MSENHEVKDDLLGLGSDWLSSPEFERGWRRFTASVLRESLSLAKFVGTWALENDHEARRRYTKKLQEQLTNGCAAWLWISGLGSKDFTFAECCEVCDLDPNLVREAFYALFQSEDDIKKIDRWVIRRCELTGCLDEDGDYED